MAKKPRDPDDEKPDAPEATPPAVDDPDKAILRGGPGDPPAEAPADEKPDQPSRARVKIGKREFEVDPDLASAVEDRERDYMRGIQMDRRERDELDRYRRAATPTPPKDEGPDYNTLLFENPKQALELHKQQIREELKRDYQEDMKKSETERVWVQWWDTFYRDYPDLEGRSERAIALDGLREMADDIGDLPRPQAHERLADHVRKEILRISRKTKPASGSVLSPTGRAIVEGATGDRSPQPTRPSPDDEPKSLSDEIRARNRRRREAKSA